jgi:hypothetical protein
MSTYKIKLNTLGPTTPKTTAEIAAANGIGVDEALAELKARKDAGVVVRHGATRATAWTRAA